MARKSRHERRKSFSDASRVRYRFVDDEHVAGGCQTPIFPWHSDIDGLFAKTKPSKKSTFVEWKTAPTKRKSRKKKKDSGSDTSDDSLVDPTISACNPFKMQHPERDDTRAPRNSKISRETTSSTESTSSSASSPSRKENFPPGPRDMDDNTSSKYKNLGKFKNDTTYHGDNSVPLDGKELRRPKSFTSHEENGFEDLRAIKQELADLKRWAKAKKDRAKGKKVVQFAHPLITSLQYRPRTEPEEIDNLFFREDDLLDWECDRETTSPEIVECSIGPNVRGPVRVAVKYKRFFDPFSGYRSPNSSYEE